MSPLARGAARIMASIRKNELKTIWTPTFEASYSAVATANVDAGASKPVEPHHANAPVNSGMMFAQARARMETTKLWQIMERMPKGALLHAHLEAMVDVDWLIDQIFTEGQVNRDGSVKGGFCIVAPKALDASATDESAFGRIASFQMRFYTSTEFEAHAANAAAAASIWSPSYQPNTPIPLLIAGTTFPKDGTDGFKAWLWSRCVITPEETICHHHSQDAIWRKFQSCFGVLGWLVMYEPIFRRALLRLLSQLAEGGITYVDFRSAFLFEFRRTGNPHGEVGGDGLDAFYEVFDSVDKEFKNSELGRAKGWRGARVIWTVMRFMGDRDIVRWMKECVRIKLKWPHLVCGFDFVAQEDAGKPLADLTRLIFWFRKHCLENGVDIPFFFHAGETLGDGDGADQNLFDAILMGARRIGHGYSLYKHPLLIEMCKGKKILVESCPISNEILRLSSSILAHSLPALLARGVAISLNNDGPAVLGHGRNGLSHDFWQSYMAWENLGLEGLATMAENSIKWCAIEDQNVKDWTRTIDDGYTGKGIKADMLKEWRREFEKFCQWVILEFAEEDYEDDEDDEDGE